MYSNSNQFKSMYSIYCYSCNCLSYFVKDCNANTQDNTSTYYVNEFNFVEHAYTSIETNFIDYKNLGWYVDLEASNYFTKVRAWLKLVDIEYFDRNVKTKDGKIYNINAMGSSNLQTNSRLIK